MDLQCKQCAARYFNTAEGKTSYGTHLDWHFRQNRKNKDKDRKIISRDWYVTEDVWMQEIDDVGGVEAKGIVCIPPRNNFALSSIRPISLTINYFYCFQIAND
jgi:hypothetical protein